MDTQWITRPVDFFSYYKMIWLFIATFCAFIAFIGYSYLNNTFMIKNTLYYVPMAVYSLFVLLSSLFSEYLYVSLVGFPDRYEGMLVLLSYIAVLFITINIVNSERHVKILLGGLTASGTALGIFGFLQYFGYDFFKTDLARRVILPADLYQEGYSFTVRYGIHRVYLTMYNPNYVGSYMVMLFCLSLAVYILVRKNSYKVFSGAFSILIFINLIGSQSRAGFIGCIAGTIILVILLRKKLVPNFKYLIAIFLCYTFVFVGMNYVSEGALSRGLSLSRGVRDLTVQYEEGVSPFRDLIFNEREMSIITDDATLVIMLDNNNQFLFFDDEGGVVSAESFKEDNKIYIVFQEEEYKDFLFRIDEDEGIMYFIYDRVRAEFIVTDKGFMILGSLRKPYSISEVESWFFEDRERFASSRGYIWSRSLPLLKDSWFLGTGADTFALYFPQDDIVGKLNVFGHTKMMVDKPHNLYLQAAINTGFPSLIALICLFALYSLQSFRLFWKSDFDTFFPIIGVGIFTAFIGYAVSGLFNDSVISVAPVFWVLLGIGISINLKLDYNKSSSVQRDTNS